MRIVRPSFSRISLACLSLAALIAFAQGPSPLPAGTEPSTSSNLPAGSPDLQFLKTNCFDCHSGSASEAGLDLTTLSTDLTDKAAAQRWTQIHDRVRDGEMPPKDSGKLNPRDQNAFVSSTAQWIQTVQKAHQSEVGRVRGRRLTRRELERTLQDLLGIDIDLKHRISEETSAAEFSTIAEGQSVSHFQLEKHLEVVDLALDEAYRRAFSKEKLHSVRLTPDKIGFAPPKKGFREFEVHNGKAVTYACGQAFYGRIPATTVPNDGWYKIRMRITAVRPPASGGVWASIQSGRLVSSSPLMDWIGYVEAETKPKEVEYEAWLFAKDLLEIRPADVTLKKMKTQSAGNTTYGEGEEQGTSGIALDWLSLQQFHRGPDDAGIRKLLFGAIRFDAAGKPVVSGSSGSDAAYAMTQFAERAFRRPVATSEILPYLQLVREAQDKGQDIITALRAGYRAILCSPRFLYLMETPGELDDYAVACRLSYMLTGSMPDTQLMAVAKSGKLKDPMNLRKQTDRLLAGSGSKRFVADFTDEWLDLSEIEFTEPDRVLCPDFDRIVQYSMLDETRTYIDQMLTSNLPVANLIDSSYTFLNSRLARYYGIDGVKGDALRRTVVKPEHRRGGILTQGAILKVTANGTNTSPVIRGVWVSEKLLGQTIPPPPSNVPAIEPDIRGAKTVREQLAKHAASDSCAACHVKIDPAGFALENYDPGGKWRDKYVSVVNRSRKAGPPVDPAHTLPDGRKFSSIEEFRRLLITDPKNLSRNVAEKLVTYGTGAHVSFADREEIDRIVAASASKRYGFRTILDNVIASPLFLTK